MLRLKEGCEMREKVEMFSINLWKAKVTRCDLLCMQG